MCENPHELDSGFIPSLDDSDRFWTSELFVARDALDSILKRSRGNGGDLDRIVSFDALLIPQLETNARIIAALSNSFV